MQRAGGIGGGIEKILAGGKEVIIKNASTQIALIPSFSQLMLGEGRDEGRMREAKVDPAS
jgi:hypothetical protein